MMNNVHEYPGLRLYTAKSLYIRLVPLVARKNKHAVHEWYVVDEPDSDRLSYALRSSIGPSFRITCSSLSSAAFISCDKLSGTTRRCAIYIDELSQAAGLAQEKYCAKEVHNYNLKVGEETLPWEVVTETLGNM